jgi:hypothetical protein
LGDDFTILVNGDLNFFQKNSSLSKLAGKPILGVFKKKVAYKKATVAIFSFRVYNKSNKSMDWGVCYGYFL